MSKLTYKLFPNRRSLSKDLKDSLVKVTDEKVNSAVSGSRHSSSYYSTGAQPKVFQEMAKVQPALPGNIRQFVHDRWNGFGPQSIWDAQGFNDWLNKVSFQSIYNKRNRSIVKMRKALDSGIWSFLVLSCLCVAFLAVDGLYLLMTKIWTDSASVGLASDLASTSLVLAAFFLLLSAACWGARELTVEIVKVRKRNATRLTA